MNFDNKNVLMLCSWYPNRVQPANGNFVEKHVRLVAANHRVQVLQVEHDPQLKHKQTEWEASSKDHYQLLTVYFGCHGSRWLCLLTRIKLFQRAFLKLRQAGNSFDLIHVHVAMPAVFMARFWQLRYQLPFVISCHSSGFLPNISNQFPWWQRWLLIRASNAARMVCPVSQALADAWCSNGLRAPVTIIPNVVDTELFYPAPTTLAYPSLKLLHISNFHPQVKNVEGILRVAKRLIEQNFPFQLTIAGDGDLPRLQAYAQALNLPSDQVILKGSLTEAEVAEQMRKHHIFLLFSNYETQGVTLLEAQCCGLPVIATKVGGIPEIVDEEWKGVLVKAGDEEGLEKSITKQGERLANTPNSASISKAARLKYDKQVIRHQFNQLYEKALAK